MIENHQKNKAILILKTRQERKSGRQRSNFAEYFRLRKRVIIHVFVLNAMKSQWRRKKKRKWSRSVVSNSLWPYGLKPTRLLCPWGFSRQEYWSGLPFPSPIEEKIIKKKSQFLSKCMTAFSRPTSWVTKGYNWHKLVIKEKKTTTLKLSVLEEYSLQTCYLLISKKHMDSYERPKNYILYLYPF